MILIEGGTRRGYISIIIYTLLLPLSIVLSIIPWLYYLNYIIAAFGFTFALLTGSLTGFFILKKDYIRGR